MKERLNYALYPFLTFLLLATTVGLGYAIHTEVENSKIKLDINTSSLLEQVAKKNGKIKCINTLTSGNYKNSPDLLGTYETRTFQSADTTFSYQHKIVDIETEISNYNQFFLLLTNDLSSKNIQLLLDSTLKSQKIYARTAIGINSTGYPVKQLPWSNDTLALSPNGCALYTMTDDFTQIHYTAYLKYTPATIWTSMNKLSILLWGLALFIIGCLLITEKKKKKNKISEKVEIVELPSTEEQEKTIPTEEEEKPCPEEVEEVPSTVETEKDSCAEEVEEILPIEETEETPPIEEVEKVLSIKDEYIVFGKKRSKLAPQPLNILQMLLNDEQHRVEKKELKKLWTEKGNPTSSMTSAVNRINNALKEVDYPEKIATASDNRDLYVLKTINRQKDKKARNR